MSHLSAQQLMERTVSKNVFPNDQDHFEAQAEALASVRTPQELLEWVKSTNGITQIDRVEGEMLSVKLSEIDDNLENYPDFTLNLTLLLGTITNYLLFKVQSKIHPDPNFDRSINNSYLRQIEEFLLRETYSINLFQFAHNSFNPELFTLLSHIIH